MFDHHTVEDLHNMSATEVLAETGTRKDAQMRHFTGKHIVLQHLTSHMYIDQSILGA